MGKGWPLRRKASKLKPLPRAYTKVGCHHHYRLIIGYLKATVVRVTLGHFKVTIGYSISKHKANITELHPKVRQTCFFLQ